MVYDALVVGAGQAGLAAGYHLQRQGLSFAILEGSNQAAGSWPRYYDSLKLFSPARYSALPSMAFPGEPDRYPARDEVVAYLTTYAARFELPVHLQTRVERVSQVGDLFEVTAADGQSYASRALIAATGAFSHPSVPALPGQSEFKGQVLHSSGYTSPAPFQGQRVVVVGAGNSAVQIAAELAQVATVSLATRQPVQFLPQQIRGRDVHFWARLTGLDTLPLGYFTNVGSSRLVIDPGEYRAALAAGQPDQRAMFTRFTAWGVAWADGTAEPVDAVIFATGFRPGLGWLEGVGALAADGYPLHWGGISRRVPGLYYVGLSGQRSLASATLRGVGSDANHVVRHLRRFLRRTAAG